MKHKYERQAWYLDDGVLIEGVTDKRGFHSNDLRCGFSTQKLTRRMIGKQVFYSLDAARRAMNK